VTNSTHNVQIVSLNPAAYFSLFDLYRIRNDMIVSSFFATGPGIIKVGFNILTFLSC